LKKRTTLNVWLARYVNVVCIWLMWRKSFKNIPYFMFDLPGMWISHIRTTFNVWLAWYVNVVCFWLM